MDTPYPITDEQVRSLNEDSWARLPGLLDPETTERLRLALLAAAPRTTISGPTKQKNDIPTLLSHEGVGWNNADVRTIATSPRVAGAVCALLRQRDALFAQDISFFKKPGASEIKFHQDYSYWPFDRQGCVTLWIALSDMDENMGPLRYIKGSHKEGPLGLIEPTDIRDDYPQLWDKEIVGGQPLKAGDAQAHWELTLHGSAANENPTRDREAVALRYIRSDTRYLGLTHPHYDQFELTPGQKFVESPDFPHIGPNGIIPR
jgi:hypothetical protein